MNAQLTDAGKIAFTTDKWTKIGMTRSFLGVTAHWFDRKSQTKKGACLAVKPLKPPHTGKAIYDAFYEILLQYSASSEHVSYVVTDKGNIVKAFKEATQLAAHARIEEEEYDASCDDERGNPFFAIICKCNDRSCIHLENDISEPEEQIDTD